MRLIDADALGIDKCNPDVFENKGYADGWNSAIYVLKNAPKVDAEPVRRGEWGMNSDIPDTIICSVCGHGFDVWKHESKDFHYCPNCGAKME